MNNLLRQVLAILVVIVFVSDVVDSSSSSYGADTNRTLSRNKRYVAFPEGSTFSVSSAAKNGAFFFI